MENKKAHLNKNLIFMNIISNVTCKIQT